MPEQPQLQIDAENRPSNYRWVIVAACVLMTLLTYGLFYSYSVFFLPLADSFNWDRASVSLIYSLAIIIRGAAAIGTGWLADKFGARKIMIFCSVMMGLGFFLSSRVTTLWQFFFTFAVIEAIGMSGIFGIGAALTSRWFTKNRGLALGIVASGSGLGTLLLVPISERLVDAVAWSQAFVIIGIATGIIMVGSALFLRPPSTQASTSQENYGRPTGFTLGEAVRDSRLWLLMFSFLLFFFGMQVVMVHLVNYARDVGIDALLAASFVSVIGAVSIAGRLSIGVSVDRIGLYPNLVITRVFLALSFVLLLFTRSAWSFYLFAVLFGIPYGAEAAQIPMAINRFFGTRAMATLVGVTVFIIGLGGAVGPWFAGKIHDITGSYNWAFIAGVISAVGSLALVGLLKRVDKGNKSLPR